ncbi:mannose-6-phosphate isomerase [Clostridium acetobutylicum]|uniref:Phosphohexomutase n=1 Tax=Clostridium acetobutylicum (strain ATCC 824 / DSM 792 / JCM 1419 / IAM 19013 / LMG 5710 / NBRC 13948 / NRRL B-527 / VKM B-1787 / 2291 / W) TaxID=272562 RepID=Q97F36_CLOAB|nr:MULTISPECIES: type I phosphomannose isomerase catalytic subunit [Clostridium]AAK80860.1 Mannose-6 phospate isomelase [Clostridium acetobutylicum ATCC 824]ADZ21962.1 Mannose-6 phospate isomelase [Clostridium acetobutylicum EA 2018]AEI33282.1 mannose-6 phospate isomelase [Clostridium acetobutylicum DSM 1731]AWV78728.1 class I mannose-6-phosphate isomerase [Clostridium acetobutylicum]MBC2393591.1 class I mannose-6-phosphate isomerase [Clostridium acetobutylicum]
MYPLKFEHLYYEKIWGGRDLEKFRNDLPDGNIGESWDVACHKNGTSVICNGEFKGKKLDELIKEKSTEIMGTKLSKEWFPLLIKLINAKSDLSVQVHPNDEYAKKVENDMGKTEVWYVVDAKEEAALVVGTSGNCTKESLKEAIESGSLDKYMNRIPVKKGDVCLVRSGMIHAICGGVTIAEIQQNSDTTYRVYDYNRGRELHVEKALDVINLNLKGKKNKGIRVTKEGYEKTYFCLGRDFSLEVYDVLEKVTEKSDKERFYIFTCVDGEGEIIYKGGKEKISFGESILIPAALGEYTVKGKVKFIKSYVPDVNKVEREILDEISY